MMLFQEWQGTGIYRGFEHVVAVAVPPYAPFQPKNLGGPALSLWQNHYNLIDREERARTAAFMSQKVLGLSLEFNGEAASGRELSREDLDSILRSDLTTLLKA